MKKMLLGAICLMSFLCVDAQTYTSGHLSVNVTDSMWHDSTRCTSLSTYTLTINVDSTFTGNTMQIIDSSTSFLFETFVDSIGTSPWMPSYTLQVNSGSNDDFAAYGGYSRFVFPTLKVVCGYDTIAYITKYDSVAVPNPCSYSSPSGMVFADINGNCIIDSGDVGLAGFFVNCMENLSSPSTFSRSYNYYLNLPGYYGWDFQQSWMTNYTVFFPSYLSFIFPYSSCFSGSYTSSTLPGTANFPLLCSSNIDVQCYVGATSTLRLHTPFYMQPYVSNTGCDTAAGVLTMIKDSRVIYDSAMSTNPAVTVSGDTLTWNYSGLSSLAAGAYWNSFFSDVYLTMDSTILVGDTLCFRVYTNVPAADINATNNDYTVCLPVVYSYDPNEKEVSPKGIGADGAIPMGTDSLIYTIHFQNTGSAEAYDITVIDTLDSHLNASSLKILGTSHNMTPEWAAPGIVKFNYNNIFLPDSFSNEPASHGWVRFSVKVNHPIANGTLIKNTGYIYFDANPAVVTNTVANTIDASLYVPPVAKVISVKIYPNPASDNITIENLEGGSASILNMNGVVLMNREITSNVTDIDIRRLPPGVYFVKTINKDRTATTKLIKY